LCEDGVDGVVGGHRHSIWSRDNLAQSYRDMRDIAAMPNTASSNSRDNTLSRDLHHINVNIRKKTLF
jgi:hypothetical protein